MAKTSFEMMLKFTDLYSLQLDEKGRKLVNKIWQTAEREGYEAGKRQGRIEASLRFMDDLK